MNPSIILIGAGNMAFHLAHAFHNSDIEILQVYNRSLKGLLRIETSTKIPTTTKISEIEPNADLYILAIKDDAISEVAQQLSSFISSKSVIIHTSGSQSIDIFQPYFTNYGAFYPLQSLIADREVDFKKIPIFITASNISTQYLLLKLGRIISNNVVKILDKDRSKLHIPAVFVNNFVNHIYSLAYEYCKKEGINFNHLVPLITETLDRIKMGDSPILFQTGPAKREDHKTINNQKKSLGQYPQILDIYTYLTNHISTYHHEDR